MAIAVDLAECKPLETWKPIHGDFLICSKLMSTWFGLVVDVDNVHETIDIIYAASPRLLFAMSPTQRKKRKKKLDIRQIKDSTTFTVTQNYGGKPVWYLR